MSETEKMDSYVMESQDSCNESLVGNATFRSTETNSLSESQDFHLVDMSDDESTTKFQQDLEESKQGETSLPVPENRVETGFDELSITESKTSSDTQGDNRTEKESMEETVMEEGGEGETANDNSSVENKQEELNDSEEIIQGTPPEVQSPMRNQGASIVIKSLKRKAESFDEPLKKILRTNSKEDVSSAGKGELGDEEACRSFKVDDDTQEFSKNYSDAQSMIIAETQDVDEDQEDGASTQKLTRYEENSRNADPQMVMKDYEIDKNENFSDTRSETVGNENRSEEVHETTKEQVQSEIVLTKGKDSGSPLRTVAAVDKLKSDSGNKNTTDNGRLVDANEAKMTNSSRADDKENGISDLERDNSDVQEVSADTRSNVYSGSVGKSRMSVEVIYDQKAVHEAKLKPKELVEIDEDGEKIVLDSSQEDSDVKNRSNSILDNTKSDTTYKSCQDSKSRSDFSYKTIESSKESSVGSGKSGNKMVNGSSESKRCDTDSTASVQSDTFTDMPVLDKADSTNASVHNVNRQIKPILKDSSDLLSVSDNEPDVYIVDDKKSSSTRTSSITKPLQIEREVGLYVRVKCLLQVDENTKEFLSKEISGVQCESVNTEPSTLRHKNDTSTSLADISGNDNKDTSPGSVNSNLPMYQLNPSRLSFASTISSSSSVSSAASLAIKLAIKGSTHFSLPKGPAKHAKKHASDVQSLNETFERLNKEWQNLQLVTTSVMNSVNAELTGVDAYNVSHERIDDRKIRSSTPEKMDTPKSAKKPAKRPRSKNAKSTGQSNGLNKIAKIASPLESDDTPNKKTSKTEHVETAPTSPERVSTKYMSEILTDDLIGKDVFAKWSDKNYYPGRVIDKIKAKYKVNFYDGQNKVLIEDFIIPIPETLRKGLSVYATTKDDYGSCGIIVDSEVVNNEVYYTVETDEGEKLRVRINDISLSSDQAQVLKEEMNTGNKVLPSTPKHLSHITLDNMVEGKRRSKRIATPSFSTPKSKLIHTPGKSEVEPSVSGVSSVKKEKKPSTESDGVSSDSNVSIKDEVSSIGVQPEIIGTPYEQIVKGPQNRIKSKSRSKKKTEDAQMIAQLGPIPRDSSLFEGTSFVLTCASLETIDRFQVDNKDYGSDPGTEDEEEWAKKPFVRDRLIKQITAGGGKVYTDFNEIPEQEYKNTKLITNVPNTTAKTLHCLSVGIPAYNHNWIIRCCQEGKIINPAENELPAGWSLEKNSYVEMFRRPSNKPLSQVVVIIPVVESEKQFSSFWQQICENAGAVVLLAEKQDAMESFVEGTVVLANSRCPPWAVEKANELQLPLLSTTWVIQCLVEGKTCPYDAQPRYKYNYKSN
ncbi:uncharacterized protein LOC108631281 [Ceratina calcarata]|uniref:Uncharacterized protein LOC108631281 n=1 Tax=Ceratina calcarata TaxID=156304 RepID=A0AAJ7JD60_9HYME|nr:uncharacterized protein LOC108631281 [Ceratina calcarata]